MRMSENYETMEGLEMERKTAQLRRCLLLMLQLVNEG